MKLFKEVIKNGEIKEQGKYQNLINKKGYFAKLYQTNK